jgi:hypothetical protein
MDTFSKEYPKGKWAALFILKKAAQRSAAVPSAATYRRIIRNGR